MGCSLLEGLCALDLTDEMGALCGKILSDLGTEVIRVEPPAGAPTRRIPPFLEDEPGPDRSLYFIAYEAGKKSVTANLNCPDGVDLVRRLAERADFLIESYPVGYLEERGLGYQEFARRNPRLVYTSITGFGDIGPAARYKARDIVLWAAGGAMSLIGEADKPPLALSLPQAGLHAGAEAAVASLLAHHARARDGLGQRVVVNAQACVVWTLMNEQAMPMMHGNEPIRQGVLFRALGSERKLVFRCADGHVSALLIGGPLAPTIRAFVQWMAERGFAADWMLTKRWEDWGPAYFMSGKGWEEARELDECAQRFFLTLTKRELYAEALKRRLLIAPVSTVADIAADEQLKARGFFVEVPDENSPQGRFIFPGPFARLSLTPIVPPRRPPRLGEHNREVYCGLLGLEPAALSRLYAQGAI
jgi:crotonobetainyl-CoA:carnitine CoA-transferase CaiB-like acyl-CoA transferase